MKQPPPIAENLDRGATSFGGRAAAALASHRLPGRGSSTNGVTRPAKATALPKAKRLRDGASRHGTTAAFGAVSSERAVGEGEIRS